jgi:hypothetical protein
MTIDNKIITKEHLLVCNKDIIFYDQLICHLDTAKDSNKHKSIWIKTFIDRVGKIDSLLIVMNGAKEIYQTMYLDKAIEEYNKILI